MVDVNTTHIAPCLHEEVITHLYCIHLKREPKLLITTVDIISNVVILAIFHFNESIPSAMWIGLGPKLNFHYIPIHSSQTDTVQPLKEEEKTAWNT